MKIISYFSFLGNHFKDKNQYRYHSDVIRQADGDNPTIVGGRMIVKQTTENEKKSMEKIRKVACEIFKKNCGANWAN